MQENKTIISLAHYVSSVPTILAHISEMNTMLCLPAKALKNALVCLTYHIYLYGNVRKGEVRYS